MNLAGVDDIDGGRGVPRPELIVAFAQRVEVLGSDDFFALTASASDSGPDNIGRRVEEDDEVGLFNAALEQATESVVEVHLVAHERLFGKQPVLLPKVVANNQVAEQVELPKVHLLGEPAREVKHLGGKGKAIGICVKGGEKGVVVAGFENEASLAVALEDVAQRGLANPDQAFDCHELCHRANPLSPAIG